MTKKLLIILTLFCFAPLYSQNAAPKLEKLYKDVAIGKCKGVDIEESLAQTKSILKLQSLIPGDKLKAFLILANLYKFKGNSSEALKMADEGMAFAGKEKMFLWQARFLGFMSTEYRESNMIDLAYEKLIQAIDIAKKAPESDEQAHFFKNAYYELAYHAVQHHDYRKALSYMRYSNQWAAKMKDMEKEFFLASGYQFMGDLFNRLHETDSAAFYLDAALKLIDHDLDINTRALRNYIYNSMGKTYLMKKDYAASKRLLQSVSADSAQFRTIDLNQELYSNLVDYYRDTENTDSSKIYREKLDSIAVLINETNLNTVNTVTQNLNRENRLLREANNNSYWYMVGLMGIMGIAVFSYTRIGLKKTQVGYVAGTESKAEELHIAKDTENRIEQQIREFEESKSYLEQNISATQLANQINTNPKYITHVLKKMYGKEVDFSTYINTLRINYITELLEKDAGYRQYKIGYLAEIAGYSSHSKFTSVFRKVKGCSPSEYMISLEKKNTPS